MFKRIVLITLLCSILSLSSSTFSQEGEHKDVSGILQEKQPPTPEENESNFTKTGSFQALDKITTRISALKLKLDETSKFSNLEITLHKCWLAPPEEKPESKALVEIWENIPSEKKKQIFYGWMFSSSPSLSALEHPVYDITLIECNPNKPLIKAVPSKIIHQDVPVNENDTDPEDDSLSD